MSKGHEFICPADPTLAPTRANQHWTNSTTGDTWLSNGTASVANWILQNQGTDIKAKVSANDTTAGFLQDKFVPGSNKVTVTEVNDGADEDLEIDVVEANVDHDALSNFVANEHIDWTAAGAGTIDQTNYVDNDTVYSHPNHTGEVTSTGDGAQVVDKTAITNKTLVTADVADTILIADYSDSDNLKKVTVQTIADLASGGGGSSAVFNITFGAYSHFHLKVKDTAYKAAAAIYFEGTTDVGSPTVGKMQFTNKGSITSSIRIYDVTNSAVICEVTGLDPAIEEVFEEIDLGTISNLSPGLALWEIQVKGTSAGSGEETFISAFILK